MPMPVVALVLPLPVRRRCRLAAGQPADHLPRVRARADQLRQVFLNLILNAQQAVEGRGEITIRTSTNVQSLQPSISVEISDTGHGIKQGAKGLGDSIADKVDDVKDRMDGNPASRPGRDATDRPGR